jgi:hypothetical protein
MARKRPPLIVDVAKARQDREFLVAMTTDEAGDERAKSRARLILTLAEGADLEAAARLAGMSVGTARAKVRLFNEGGWKALLTVQAPRGGDFLARYDQGFWAERLTRVYLDQSRDYRAIPYGTSRSEPFTDMQTFRQHMETEFLLQAWSAQGRWKRPDLLMIPRTLLRKQQGNDSWTPDLQHLDNNRCRPYVERAAAAIEVETSLWQVQRAIQARVSLSFTVKEEWRHCEIGCGSTACPCSSCRCSTIRLTRCPSPPWSSLSSFPRRTRAAWPGPGIGSPGR